jgi:hypothetical protein
MKILHTVLALVVLSVISFAQESKPERPSFPSPDKKCDFRVTNEAAGLVIAGSDAIVVNRGEEIGYLASERGYLVWVPDSRRFAFSSRAGGKSYVCELYERAGAFTQSRIRMLVFHCFDIKAFRSSILPVGCHFRI